MKNLFLIILAFTLVPFTALADGDDPRTISVTGEAELMLEPDEVVVTFMAENRGADLQEVKSANDKAVSAVLAYAKKGLRVPPKHLQTAYVQIHPQYRQCNYKQQQNNTCNPLNIIGYHVRKDIQITLHQLGQYEPLVEKALEVGVTHIKGVQFKLKERNAHKHNVQQMAVADAKSRADLIAGSLGQRVGSPLTIALDSFHSGYPRSQPRAEFAKSMLHAGAAAGGGDSTIATGQIRVSGRVSIVFELED